MSAPDASRGPANCLPIRNGVVTFHLLLDGHNRRGVHLIDAGFIGGLDLLAKWLASLGRNFADIRSVVLTHGHLDHTLNVAEIRQRSGSACRIFAPKQDRAHVAGTARYRGWSRLCGISEAIGRRVLRYRAPDVDHWFDADETLDVWGGLRVIPLPGHTLGHSGLLSLENDLLFAGDLFSNYLGRPELPPPWLNVDHAAAQASVIDAAEIARSAGVAQVALNHARSTSGESHLRDLLRLADRLARGSLRP